MNRKVYCPCDSDFTKHYLQQSGTGISDITIFRGQPYQRGYGFGSVLKRFGIPILRFLGKQLVKTGVDIGNDMLSGNDFRASIRSRGREGLRNAAKDGLHKLNELVDQTGTGLRKRKKKSTKKTKKRKKDIFS